jgi:hypothetical protein
VLGRVGLEERPDRSGAVARVDLLEPLADLLVVDPEVGPGPIRRHRGEHGRAALLGPRGLDQVGHEVGLRRDRQQRMGVEHHPQQRRPRPRQADDEGRRRPGLVDPIAVTADPAQRRSAHPRSSSPSPSAAGAVAAGGSPTTS